MEQFVHDAYVDDLLRRIHLVRDVRLAQASDQKKFQSAFSGMVRSYNRMMATEPRSMPTPQEQALLDRQQHYDFSELSQQEQMKLKSEMDSMWGQIPAHLQDKARKLAGVN